MLILSMKTRVIRDRLVADILGVPTIVGIFIRDEHGTVVDFRRIG